MFCYNCGQKINNSILKCPYCDQVFDFDKLDKIIFDKTIDTIAQHCQEIPSPHSKVFHVASHDIIIADEMYIYAFVNCFINNLQTDFNKNLQNYIHSNHLGKLVEDGEKYLYERFENILYAILAYMKRNNIAVTAKKFADIKSYLAAIPFMWEPVYVVASHFEELQSVLADRRKSMDKSKSSHWIGGGFGIQGAIKGQIQASILNAGESLMTSVGNVTRRTIQSHIDSSNIRKAKTEIIESSKFFNEITTTSNDCFNDLRKYLLRQLCQDSEGSIEIARNVIGKKHKENFNMSVNNSIESLAANPFCVDPYVSLYKRDRNNGASLSEIAIFCGIERDVYYYNILKVDSDIFNDDSLGLHTVGYDTNLKELLKIKDALINLEINNPGFVSDNRLLFVEEEQNYHHKIDELLSLAKKGEAEKTIADAFSNYSKKDATRILISLNDKLIKQLLREKFIAEIKNIGKTEFLNQFEECYPLLVMEVVLMVERPDFTKQLRKLDF